MSQESTQPKRPVSDAKRAANRANAQKSTGPRTPEGKAISSRNAIRHGLLARDLVLPDDPVENESDFHALLNALFEQFNPVGPFEKLLVERIAVCHWRLARATRFECRSIHDDREAEHAPWMELQRTVTGRPADPARHILPVTHDLDTLIRYEGLIDRELHRALAHFHRFRTERLAAAQTPADRQFADPPAAQKKTVQNEATKTAFLTPPAAIEAPKA